MQILSKIKNIFWETHLTQSAPWWVNCSSSLLKKLYRKKTIVKATYSLISNQLGAGQRTFSPVVFKFVGFELVFTIFVRAHSERHENQWKSEEIRVRALHFEKTKKEKTRALEKAVALFQSSKARAAALSQKICRCTLALFLFSLHSAQVLLTLHARPFLRRLHSKHFPFVFLRALSLPCTLSHFIVSQSFATLVAVSKLSKVVYVASPRESCRRWIAVAARLLPNFCDVAALWKKSQSAVVSSRILTTTFTTIVAALSRPNFCDAAALSRKIQGAAVVSLLLTANFLAMNVNSAMSLHSPKNSSNIGDFVAGPHFLRFLTAL